jgi:transcriptional regulator GlxA family with amidase domain
MDARVRAAIKVMDDLIADELSIRSLARSVNLSPGRLRQLFKKDTGRSPMQYLKCLRMKKAADLLQSSFLTIKEIIFQTGARDASNFVRDFKKRYALTPSEFRARNERLRQRSVDIRSIAE